MTPKVEFNVPANVSDQEIMTAIRSLKATEVSITGEKQIDISQICVPTMTRFLKHEQPNFNPEPQKDFYYDHWNFRPIFTALSYLTQDRQDELITHFFLKDVFPFENADSFVKLVLEAHHFTFLKPSKPLEARLVKDLGEEYLYELGWEKDELPVKIVDNLKDASQVLERVTSLKSNPVDFKSKFWRMEVKKDTAYHVFAKRDGTQTEMNLSQKVVDGALSTNLRRQIQANAFGSELLKAKEDEIRREAGNLARRTIINDNEIGSASVVYFDLLRMGCLPLGVDNGIYKIFAPQAK